MKHIRLVREPRTFGSLWFPPSLAFSRAKALQKCDFHKEVVQKLKFPNNSIIIKPEHGRVTIL